MGRYDGPVDLLPDWCRSPRLRFVTPGQALELLDLWHTTVAEKPRTSHERLLLACRWFSEAHPEVSEGAAYKDLEAILHEDPAPGAAPARAQRKRGLRFAVQPACWEAPSGPEAVLRREGAGAGNGHAWDLHAAGAHVPATWAAPHAPDHLAKEAERALDRAMTDEELALFSSEFKRAFEDAAEIIRGRRNDDT
jgi:hypothetical protein